MPVLNNDIYLSYLRPVLQRLPQPMPPAMILAEPAPYSDLWLPRLTVPQILPPRFPYVCNFPLPKCRPRHIVSLTMYHHLCRLLLIYTSQPPACWSARLRLQIQYLMLLLQSWIEAPPMLKQPRCSHRCPR